MKSLKVKIARAERFGRLSSKSVELSDGNFTVVLGPNESGKSTLAELISWVIAGRRKSMDRRFLTSLEIDDGKTADLKAGIEGIIDGKSFTASRKFTVRPASTGKEKTVSTPEITIDTKSVSLETWQHEIGVKDEDDYLRYYRITGPNDPSNKIDLKDVLTALAVGADVTLPPRKVAEYLEANSKEIVANRKGKRGKDLRKFELAEDNYKNAKSGIKEIEESSKKIEIYRDHILEAQVKIQEIDTELTRARKEHGDLLATKNLLGIQIQKDAVVLELREFDYLSDSDSRMYEQRADINELIRQIKTKSLQIAALLSDLEKKQLSIGLSAMDLSSVTLDEQTVERIRLLHEDKVHLINQLDQLETKQSELEADRKTSSERLGRFATQFEVGANQLMEFGQLSLDDMSFGDPIRDWDQAEKSALSPVETAVISSTGKTDGSNSRVYISLMIFGALVATGSQFLPQSFSRSVSVIGFAISVIAGFLTMFGRKSSNVETTPSLHVEKQNPGIEERKQKALQVLREHGFVVPFTVEKAMSLRGARTDIQNLVASINSNSLKISTNSANIARLNGQIELKKVELEDLSIGIGLVGYGSDLLPGFARDLHAVILTRLQYERDERDIAIVRSNLDALTEMKFDNQSVAQIELLFGDLCVDIDKRDGLESDRKGFQTLIDIGAPKGGRIADLLQNSELSDSEIDVRLEELDSKIKIEIENQQAISNEAYHKERELEALEADSDLPTFTYAEKQSKMEMGKWATEGAAVLLAEKIVLDVANDVEAKNQPGLVKRSSEIAKEITDGFWSNLKSDEGGVRVLQNGQWITEDALSAGARDVLRFSIRLAAAEAHSTKHGIALPLILDDPTSSVDADRRHKMLKVLSGFSSNHQVILLTHESEVSRIAVSNGAVQVALT